MYWRQSECAAFGPGPLSLVSIELQNGNACLALIQSPARPLAALSIHWLMTMRLKHTHRRKVFFFFNDKKCMHIYYGLREEYIHVYV